MCAVPTPSDPWPCCATSPAADNDATSAADRHRRTWRRLELTARFDRLGRSRPAVTQRASARCRGPKCSARYAMSAV